LALQKKEVELFTSVHYGERTYPRKKQAKEKMFGKTLMYRKEQRLTTSFLNGVQSAVPRY
uniref:hypothetical protein n=1 Tax=Enterococcus faecium TaxID=1352 RepID=UPI00292D557D